MTKNISSARLDKIKTVASKRQRDLVLVLEDIYDPHNAAAILRSADGFGVQKVYFIFEKVAYYNPKKVGKVSSSSANKWLDFEIFRSTRECLMKLKRRGYKILATVLDDKAQDIFKANFLQYNKIALLLGNEHAGLSEEALVLSSQKIYIPMRGMVQSFNVSVTAAIFLFEITRQRQESKKDFSLSLSAQKKLIAGFKRR